MVALREFEPLRQRIEATAIGFAPDSSALEETQLRPVAAAIRQLVEITATAGSRFTVSIAGSADPTGARDRNERLARQRAAAVAEALVRLGVDRNLLEPKAMEGSSREVRFTIRTTGAAK